MIPNYDDSYLFDEEKYRAVYSYGDQESNNEDEEK